MALLLVPPRLALMAVLRTVALDELVEVCTFAGAVRR